MDSGSKSVDQLKAIPFNIRTNCFTSKSLSMPILLRISMKCATCCFGVTSPVKLVEFGTLVAIRHTESVDPLRVGFGVEMTLL